MNQKYNKNNQNSRPRQAAMGRRRKRRPNRLPIAILVSISIPIFITIGIFGVRGTDSGAVSSGFTRGLGGLGSAGIQALPTLDPSLLNVDFDEAQLVYRFYYADTPLDLSRHIVVDEGSAVRLITFSPSDNLLSVYTHFPVIIDIDYEDGNIYIVLTSPRQVYSRIVVLDPGEGGDNPGAVVNNIRESDLNLDIARLVYEMLETSPSDIKPFLTRRGHYDPSLAERPAFANAVGDLFVSIHNNAFDGNAPHLVYGTEVLFNPNNPHLLYENFGRLNIDNSELAQIFQDYLVDALDTRDRGILPRTDLAVLNPIRIPAVLVEVEFMTSPAGLANLTDPSFQHAAAEAIYRGILVAFEFDSN